MAIEAVSCARCGAQSPKRSGRGNQRKYCDECRPLMRRGWRQADGIWRPARPVYGKPFECVQCGKVSPATGPFQKRCSACRQLKRALQSHAWRKRVGYQNPKAKTHIGDKVCCPECGAIFTKASSFQKFCDACRANYRQIHYRRTEVKLKHCMNTRVKMAVKTGRQPRGWENRFEFTVGQLVVHLERQFLPGMSWENYGKAGWHIDHVLPIANFDLSRPEEIRACWALSNLRPLWAGDNRRKHAKRTLLI
jgi:hypothetical protein